MKTQNYPCLKRMPLNALDPYPQNPRVVTSEGLAQLNKQLDELGNLQPITFNVRTKRVISGNQRMKIYQQRGGKETDVWCVDLPEEKERIAVLALNNHVGDFDVENLKTITELIANSREDGMDDLELSGFKPGELERLLAMSAEQEGGGGNTEVGKQEAHKTLAEIFLIPPFSTLDARQGYWQLRKAAWIALGLKGEVGRGDNP